MADSTLGKIGKYDIVGILGKGGMGVVYKAMDPAIGRLVAIKMMTSGFAENPDLLQRFYREAKSTGTLQHPGIVIVHDLGEHQGNPYLVMEFLEGEPLSEIIVTRRKLSLSTKLGYIIQALHGLGYAHRKGIVHRDIKPANLMVLGDGAVKIVDFGIARLGDQRLTKTGQVMGTITYMSPEQINAQVVDGRTDIFSTGVMLYELLTYALPFEGRDTTSTMLKILSEAPPPLETFLSVSPPELEAILHKALAKNREERYATAEDFAFELRRVQESLEKQSLGEYVEQARASLEQRDLGKAKELLQQVLRVDTQHRAAQELMQEVQQRLQTQQRSEQVRELRSHAENALAHQLYDDSLAYAEEALALDKTDPALLRLRDQAQQARDQKRKANHALADAVQEALHRQDREAAGKLVRDALAQSPEDSVVLKLQAQVARQTGPLTGVETPAPPAPAQTVVAGSWESSGKMPALPDPPAHLDKTLAVPPPASPAHAGAESRGANVGPTAQKKSLALKIALAAAALAVVVVGSYLALKKPGGLVGPGTYLEVHAVPWGTVKTVTSADGKLAITVNQQTPARVSVPPGNYTVVIAGPDGEEKSEECTVFENQPGSCNAVFQKLRRSGQR